MDKILMIIYYIEKYFNDRGNSFNDVIKRAIYNIKYGELFGEQKYLYNVEDIENDIRNIYKETIIRKGKFSDEKFNNEVCNIKVRKNELKEGKVDITKFFIAFTVLSSIILAGLNGSYLFKYTKISDNITKLKENVNDLDISTIDNKKLIKLKDSTDLLLSKYYEVTSDIYIYIITGCCIIFLILLFSHIYTIAANKNYSSFLEFCELQLEFIKMENEKSEKEKKSTSTSINVNILDREDMQVVLSKLDLMIEQSYKYMSKLDDITINKELKPDKTDEAGAIQTITEEIKETNKTLVNLVQLYERIGDNKDTEVSTDVIKQEEISMFKLRVFNTYNELKIHAFNIDLEASRLEGEKGKAFYTISKEIRSILDRLV